MANDTKREENGATSEWDKKELGVLWRKTSKREEKYLNGTLNLKSLGFPDQDVPIIIFANKSKKKDTHPDLSIYLSERREASGATVPSTPKVAVKPPAKIVDEPVPVQNDEELI